jgi:hypothetical protein
MQTRSMGNHRRVSPKMPRKALQKWHLPPMPRRFSTGTAERKQTQLLSMTSPSPDRQTAA